MRRPETRFLLTATGGLALSAAGCLPWSCPDVRRTSFDFRSDEFLDLGGSSWGEDDQQPVLHIVVAHESAGSSSRDYPLAYVPEEGFALPEMAFVACPCDTDRGCPAESYRLSFDLDGGVDGDTGAEDFSTVTVEGTATEVDLWAGWTVDIQVVQFSLYAPCP